MTFDQSEYQDTSMSNFELDYGCILWLLESCLENEIDWRVLCRVLTELPYILQYEMNMIKESDFTEKLFKLVILRILKIFIIFFLKNYYLFSYTKKNRTF